MSAVRNVCTLLIAIVLVGCATSGASTAPSPSGSRAPSPAPTASESLPAPTPSTPAPPTASPDRSPSPTTAPTSAPVATPTAAPTPVPTMIVRAYFLMPPPHSDAATLVPVLRTVPQSSVTLRAAFAALLAGPNAKEQAAYPPLETLVPTGTRLLSVKLVDGTATVDLSREFFANSYLIEVEAKVGQVVHVDAVLGRASGGVPDGGGHGAGRRGGVEVGCQAHRT